MPSSLVRCGLLPHNDAVPGMLAAEDLFRFPNTPKASGSPLVEDLEQDTQLACDAHSVPDASCPRADQMRLVCGDAAHKPGFLKELFPSLKGLRPLSLYLGQPDLHVFRHTLFPANVVDADAPAGSCHPYHFADRSLLVQNACSAFGNDHVEGIAIKGQVVCIASSELCVDVSFSGLRPGLLNHMIGRVDPNSLATEFLY